MIYFHELATSALLRRAVMEAVGVGAICGAIGAHVVLRRLSFFTVTISHATFPGVVIASILGASLFLGGAVTALAVVMAVGIVGSQRRLDSSTATGVVLAGAFALGVLLLSAQPRATTDLTSFLVGSLLTVSHGDLVLTAVVAVVVIAVLSALHKELVLGAFDREGAEALGFRPLWLDLAVLTLVAITVVTAVPAVGTILVVALLVTPALTARLWTERIGSMMVLGAALGALSGFVGLWVATQARIAAGASVVLVSSALLALSLAARGARQTSVYGRPGCPDVSSFGSL